MFFPPSLVVQSWRPALHPVSSPRPLALDRLSAGFPSPAQDYEEQRLDIAKMMIDNPVSTYFFRVVGDSMIQAEIFPGDMLVVDRSKTPQHRSIVVAVLNGERTVKYLCLKDGPPRLEAANPNYRPIELTESMEMTVFGVVIGKFKRLVP